MQYRDYGNTGKVSALGFGCMRLPEFEKDGKWYIDEEKAIPMLRRAAELGVNYFDTGYFYCHHNSEAIVGKALKPIRSQVMISTKCPMGDDFAKIGHFRGWLERSLGQLDSPYVDYYHFWGIDKETFDEKIVKLGMLREALALKDEGLIRHISFSFHGDPGDIRHIIDRGEVFETMLVQYNLLDRSNEEMIAYAAGRGLGVAAMGPVGGGRLAAPTELYARMTDARIAGRESMATYELALKYVLGNPSISCALSGMGDMDMLLKNADIANEEITLSTGEWTRIGDSLERLRRFSDLYCTGCAYCQPCPAGIDIPKLFGAYTYHNVYELHDHAKKEFAKYLEESAAFKDCTGCGQCERACPQKLEVRKELQRVEEILSKL